MSIEQSSNFRRIDERLTTSGLLGVEELSALRGEGYDAVINLLPDTSGRAVVNEEAIVREQGLEYVHIPVDFAAPAHADLEAFTDAMDALAGKKVHVHCAANYRVSAFYALYAQRTGSCTEAEADALIRSVWDPADHPPWPEFIRDERQR
ncbi:MAG TPA: protein tyrosine phosphatase family protein [Acidimicrobiia bacterium]|nr:protein tyrosine phosphatase family protein [Acidimicrobiia bacterium]